MQREEFRELVSNPEAMSAMMQIQQGMMRLQATNPLLLNQQNGYVYHTRRIIYLCTNFFCIVPWIHHTHTLKLYEIILHVGLFPPLLIQVDGSAPSLFL